MAGLLDGKKGLVLNIANDRSIAWHIANNAIKHGATCGFGFLPMEKMERRGRKTLEGRGGEEAGGGPGGGGPPARNQTFFKAGRAKVGTNDFLLSSLAVANKD